MVAGPAAYGPSDAVLPGGRTLSEELPHRPKDGALHALRTGTFICQVPYCQSNGACTAPRTRMSSVQWSLYCPSHLDVLRCSATVNWSSCSDVLLCCAELYRPSFKPFCPVQKGCSVLCAMVYRPSRPDVLRTGARVYRTCLRLLRPLL